MYLLIIVLELSSQWVHFRGVKYTPWCCSLSSVSSGLETILIFLKPPAVWYYLSSNNFKDLAYAMNNDKVNVNFSLKLKTEITCCTMLLQILCLDFQFNSFKTTFFIKSIRTKSSTCKAITKRINIKTSTSTMSRHACRAWHNIYPMIPYTQKVFISTNFRHFR